MAAYTVRERLAKSPMVRSAAAALLAVTMLLAAEAGSAADEQATDALADAWQVEFIPYLWLTEVHGSVGLGPLTVPINVGFDKVFDLMGKGDLLGGMGYLEARRGRLGFYLDAVGSVVRTDQNVSGVPTDLTADFATLEFGVGYRVYDGYDGAITIDALAGGRFNYLYNSIDPQGGSTQDRKRNASIDFVDPLVGGRWAVRLIGPLSLLFRGDIGGFGAGSELAWGLLAGFRYETPWTLGPARLNAFACYKVYDFDYQSGSGASRRAIAEEYRGPALGLGARF